MSNSPIALTTQYLSGLQIIIYFSHLYLSPFIIPLCQYRHLFFPFWNYYSNPLVDFPVSNQLPYPSYMLLIMPLAILKIFRDSIKSKFLFLQPDCPPVLPFQIQVCIPHIKASYLHADCSLFPHACHILLSPPPSLRYLSPSEIPLHPI